jgi:hypothetical protein
MRLGRPAEARVFARFYAWALSRSVAGHGGATQLQQPRRGFDGTEHIQGVVATGIRAPTGSACAESEAMRSGHGRSEFAGQKIKLIPRFSLHR